MSSPHENAAMSAAARSVGPSIATDELEGPLCALSLYLSVAEGALKAQHIDRDRVFRSLQSARAELDVLAAKLDAACRQRD